MSRLGEKVSDVIFKSKMFSLEKFSFRIKGKKFTFERVKGPDSVAVLPILEDGRILLEWQRRHAIGKRIYEVPAGHIDEGETPEQAAARELGEETGYRLGLLKFMFKGYTSPGLRTQLEYAYVATDLKKTRINREEDEVMDIRAFTIPEAVEMVRKGKIEDMKTVACIMYYVSSYWELSSHAARKAAKW